MAIKTAKSSKATGKLKVSSGIRLPWIALPFLEGFSPPVKSLPHTRQRVASSLTRVPQVGQSLVGLEGVSDVIGINKLAKEASLRDYTSLFNPLRTDSTLDQAWYTARRCTHIVSTCTSLSAGIAVDIVILTPMPGRRI
jgi:hypothetical protein